MSTLTPYSVGIDRETGAVLTDFDHVAQSVVVILSTRFGERVMREWVGSPVVGLLGRLVNASEILTFFTAVQATIDTFEPRLKVRKIEPLSVSRAGALGIRIIVEYRPRGHLGDTAPEAALRTINASYDTGRWNVQGVLS
jgi:phage baseplate assembly protein W